MIFKRFAANLRAQNWFAIGIEFTIVVAGVFVGTQVSNLNEARIERVENERMLRNLKPEIVSMIGNFQSIQDYYEITRRYAATAFAGWRRDPKVDDRAFVLAAYQASQSYYTGVSGDTWSQIYGSERLGTIEDRDVRKYLSLLMTTDYAVLEKELNSDYRQHVRQVIPDDVQDAIRDQCGDRTIEGTPGWLQLPETCELNLPANRIAVAASALRANPQLVGELNWHIAATVSYRANLANLSDISKKLLARL
ncbi:MAG: hypothetical protein ABI667_00380 [Sphingomicrobium sp.]